MLAAHVYVKVCSMKIFEIFMYLCDVFMHVSRNALICTLLFVLFLKQEVRPLPINITLSVTEF